MKKVQITIIGKQESEDDPQEYELVTEGTLTRRGGETSFSYMESEITGLDGVKTTFTLHEDGSIVLRRDGCVNTQMVFEEGRKHYTMYETPYGALSMGVTALEAAATEKNGELFISIHYAIDVDSSEINRNLFKINVREV